MIPPQGGKSVAPPWLYCVPSHRLPEWYDFPDIRVGFGTSPMNRAAFWLAGDEDATFDEILKACNSFPGNLKKLSTVALAADRLDKLRKFSEPSNALELLRTLAVLAPHPNTAANLKADALRELNRSFNKVETKFALSLRNLDPVSLPSQGLPKKALTRWVGCQAIVAPKFKTIV